MMFSGGKVYRKVKLRYTERLNKNFQASLKLSEKTDVTPSKQTRIPSAKLPNPRGNLPLT